MGYAENAHLGRKSNVRATRVHAETITGIVSSTADNNGANNYAGANARPNIFFTVESRPIAHDLRVTRGPLGERAEVRETYHASARRYARATRREAETREPY